MLTPLILMVALLIGFGPDNPTVRALRACLVKWPARQFLDTDRRGLLLLFILPALFLFGGEVLLLFGPEFLITYAVNLSLYFDAVAVSAFLAASSGLKNVGGSVRNIVRQIRRIPQRTPRPSARAHRSSSTILSALVPNDNDDEDSRRMVA